MPNTKDINIDELLAMGNESPSVEPETAVEVPEINIDELLEGWEPTADNSATPYGEKGDDGQVKFIGAEGIKTHSTAEDAPATPIVPNIEAQKELERHKILAAKIAAETAALGETTEDAAFKMPVVDLGLNAEDLGDPRKLVANSVKKQLEGIAMPKTSIFEAEYADFVEAIPTNNGEVRTPVDTNQMEQEAYSDLMRDTPKVPKKEALLSKATIRSYFPKDKNGAYLLPNGKKINSDALFEEYVNNFYEQYNHPTLMKEDDNYRKNYFLRNFHTTEEEFVRDFAKNMTARLDKIEADYADYVDKLWTDEKMKQDAWRDLTREYTPMRKEDPLRRAINDARKIINSAEKDNYWRGFAETFSWEDIASYGMSGISSTVDELTALNKYIEGEPLNDQEKLYIDLSMLKQEVAEFRSAYNDRGTFSWNRVGNIVGHMPQFMFELGLTGTAFSTIGKKAAKEITFKAVRDAMKQSTSEGLKMAGKKLGYSVIQDALATPTMAMSYKNLADRRLRHYSWEDSQLLKQEAPLLLDYAKALGETFVERHSEAIGLWITEGMVYGGKVLAQAKFLDNAFGRTLRKVANVTVPETVRNIRKTFRIGGYTGEVGSEIYNNLINPLFTGETEAWRQLCTDEYYWELMVSMAIPGVAHYAMAVPSYVRHFRDIKKLQKSTSDLLSQISNQELKEMLIDVMSSDKLEAGISKLTAIDWNNVSAADAQAANRYIFDSVQMKLMQAEELETERLNAFMPLVENVSSSLYSGKNATTPTLGTKLHIAHLKDGKEALIIHGDMNDAGSTTVVARNELGETVAINKSDIEDVRVVDMSNYIAEQYNLLFSDSANKEKIANVISNLRTARQNNASNETFNQIINNAGFVFFNVGEQVTLTDGSTWVVQDHKSGYYKVAPTADSTDSVWVGFLNVLQPNQEIADAQQELANQIEESDKADTNADVYTSESSILQQSLQKKAQEMAMQDGQTIYTIRLSDGREAFVKQGNIVQNEDGSIDTDSSDATLVIKAVDSADLQQISIEDVEEVIETTTTSEVVAAAQTNIEEQIAKKNLIASIFEQYGVVDVILINGQEGKIVELIDGTTYGFIFVGQDNEVHSTAISLDYIAEVLPPQDPTTPEDTNGGKGSDTTAISAPEGTAPKQGIVNIEEVDWDSLSAEDYLNIHIMEYGPAQTLGLTRGYWKTIRKTLKDALAKVAAQDGVIASLKARFASLTGPAETLQLRKEVAEAEAERARLEAEAARIERQMQKYEYAINKLGVDTTEELVLITQREQLEAEQQKQDLDEAAKAEIDKQIAENAIAQTEFDKKVERRVAELEGGNETEENSVEKNAASSERSSVDSPNSSSGSLSLNPNGRLRVEAFGDSKRAAKVSEIIENTKEIKRKIQNILNKGGISDVETDVEAVRVIGKKLGLRKSQSSLSYYRELYEGNYLVDENTLYLRVSTHPATDTRMGNEPADHKVSIVIRKDGKHRDTGEHNGYEEIVYEPSEITPIEAANAIIKGIQSLLETGKYIDTTGKARTTIYLPSSIPTNQSNEGENVSAMVSNTPPKGVAQEKWDVIVARLRETLGADNVITDIAEVRRVLDEILDAEGLRGMITASDIFYSDAERAVEEIKQQKATPQQWLAMLQKKGGLKVAEDKWIGLSEWLLSTDKKTLTKQEVLDYIRANKIRIEDVQYDAAGIAGTQQFQALQDEFIAIRDRIIADEWRKADEYSDELIRRYGFPDNTIDMDALREAERNNLERLQISESDADDLAWVEMLDKYGDDFEIGIGLWAGQLNVNNEDAAAAVLGLDKDSIKQINGIRLRFTTEGLENKREIALTVPTIDSWNESDKIHFGDAGNGRAIAWVRFGETTTTTTKEVIRTVELAEPYKNYRGLDIYTILGTNGRDHIVYSRLNSGEMRYVPRVNDQFIGNSFETASFATLDEAVNALSEYYKAHPIKKTVKERVLVIDEIQSNRHQEGRKRGYISKKEKTSLEALKTLKEKYGKARRDHEYRINQAWGSWQNGEISEQEYNELWRTQFNSERKLLLDQELEINEIEEDLGKYIYGRIPAAPFEQNWAELAMKRMLRYAADNGYDKVAWITGGQQAERYNIGDKVHSVSILDGRDGGSPSYRAVVLKMANIAGQYVFYVREDGTIKNTDGLARNGEFSGKNIADVIGKELADRLLSSPNNTELSGEDLHIGGEGMKAFYDKMLVSFMNKYGKKWGIRVGEVTMPNLYQNNTMHAVDVTNEMRISVLQGQPMFRAMKTSKGEVYGFTYNGKIYLDPTTLNLEAPIHEYTELWCSVIEKQNPALWAKGVELLKQTNTWEVVNSDPNYRNLSEELRASETLSRIVAAEAAKKISEVSDSKTLIAKLRAWIRKFWNELKATFSQWTKEDISKLTLREFKAMPFRDLIEGVDPRKYQVEGGNALAASVDVIGDNSLVAIHNISGSKLAKALKQGGLANPSAAVIDIAKQSHEGYGEYSFILPKNLVAKKSGKNLGTYDRDAWAPLYPTVIYSHNKTSKSNLNKLVEGLDGGLADKIKREVMMKVEGNGYYSGLQIVFLKDKGIDTPIATVTPRYAGTIEDLQKLFGDKEVTYDNYKALDQDAKNAVTIWIKARGNKADIERINGLMEQWSHKPKLIKSYTEEVGYGQFDNLLYGLQADSRNSGNPDYGKTIENAVEYIRENNLQEEFDAWETAIISNLGFDEKIQVGLTAAGDRIMRKNTLENVSAYMRKQGKNASSDHWSNSEGKMLAKLAQNFATLEQIRANKHRLLADSDAAIGIRKRMNEAAQIFMDFTKSSNLFLEEQSALAYLEDILIGGMNPDKVVAEYNKATKRNVSLTDKQKAELNELREDMKNIPVQYFETKFDRPVMFSEFAAVVAPNTMPEIIENQLREAGLTIYKYDPDVEGSRREATLQATASDSIRFMFLGEQGAAAIDAAEEATTRLNNLAVAREMENSGNDALSIKQATGWERGADQMWRYEVPDVVINQAAELVEDGETLTTTLGSLVLSDELFNAYPELRDTQVIFKELPVGSNGSYAKGKNDAVGTIILSDIFVNKTENPQWVEAMREVNAHPLVRQWNRIAYAEVFDPAAFDKADKALRQSPIWEKFNALRQENGAIPRYINQIAGQNTLVHEIQHAIQEKEGFAQGGTTTGLNTRLSDRLNELTEQIRQLRKEGRDAEADEIIKQNKGLAEAVINNDADTFGNYRKLAGEVEARNVAARLNMTPEQRRETLAAETADVAPEDQIFLYNSMESSELADENANPKAPRRSKVEKLQDKITALRNELHDNKKSLKDVLYRVYEFLTSADILNAMETGVSKSQYRSVLKAITTAIEQSYGKKDMDVVRQIVDKYLWQAEDIMARVLAHRRLNEITQILNTTVEGYTPQGVRVGKRIDEKTRNTFKTIRDAIAESFVEQTEETDNGARRKPVKYRLRNRTEDGDIATSYRLQTTGRIANIMQQADDIIADNADNTSATAIQESANLVYIANVLTSYDATLELNEQIGTVSEEIDELETKIQQATAAHRAAAPGSAEKVQLWNDLKAFRYAKEAAIQNRANLRKSYAARLKTFTETLKELVELGVANLKNAEVDKIEKEIAWKVGIYRSVKDPSAKVLPNRDYTEKGKKKSRRSAKAIKRWMLNENDFMGTFAELSKEIDIASIPGQWLEDGWYYQFMLSPEGYMFRADWRHNEEQRIQKLMEDKTKEIFERSSLWSKIKAQSFNLLNIAAYEAQKESGFKISELAIKTDKDGKIVGGVQRSVPLTIGNLLYIRNIVRQQGGKAGYVTWGISEEQLDQMVAYVEQKYPEYCQFSDWVVRELIPQLYEQQDTIYFERFGTHLTKTHDYFPIVRDKRFVGKIAEVGEGEVSMPSSVTGNIVERVKTSAKMDLTADMFTVLRNHIKETLDWIAYSELTRKFNSMSTSHAFRNMMEAQDFSVDKLKEMYEIAIGQGKINKTDNTALTKTLNTISKNLVAANLVFNFNAAAKQLISMTAILGYTADPKFIPIWAKNYFVPSVAKLGVQKIIQMVKEGTLNPAEVLDAKAFFDNWRWALENIPTLRARWESRHAGFEVFKAEGVARWEKLTSWISTVGLMPNAFVDMLTCANGARAVYEYQYAENIARGLSKEDAHRDACVKAAVMVNETQQSGLDAFISKFQAGGGMARLLGVGLGAYQNTSMSFARNEHYSFAQVIRMLRKKNRERMIDFKVQEYQRKGKSREEAEKLATKEFKLAFWSQLNSVLHNSIFSNFAWTLGGMLSSMFAVAFGSMNWDDDKWFWESESWEKFWHNEDVRRQFADIFSLGTILWQFPLVYNHPIAKQILVHLQALRKGSNYGSTFESPVVSEIDDLLESISKQWSGVVDPITGEVKKYETIRTEQTVEHIVWAFLLKTGLTLNQRVIKNISDGIKGMIEDGVDVEDIMNFLSSPRSLTRSIAGEPRKGETTEQYLDRMSYVYRLINEGSGIYDSKWQRERIDEYVRKRERPLYEAMGIDPLDAQALEAHKKAIEKILLLRRAGNLSKVKEGKANEFVGLSPKAKDVHIEMYRLKRLIDAKELQLKYMVEFDDERAALLKEKYKLEQDLYNKWKEYIKL